MTVKLRYKKPDGDTSRLIELPVLDNHSLLQSSTNNFRFSAAVAGFGMLLRDSKHKKDLTYNDILALAQGSMGQDINGYRREFIELVRKASQTD